MAVESWEPARRLRLPRVAQKIAKAQMKVFAADGITIQQFNESAGGQVVFHLHVHVIPRHDGVPIKSPTSVKEEAAVLSDQALKFATMVRPSGVPPACARHPTPRRRPDEVAHEREGRSRGAVRSGAQVRDDASDVARA
jgi:diadenosine tetraphosphate (Ap4A) HIT family hydrolase